MARNRKPHKENKGITIVAKPVTKLTVFLIAVIVVLIVILVVNAIVAAR